MDNIIASRTVALGLILSNPKIFLWNFDEALIILRQHCLGIGLCLIANITYLLKTSYRLVLLTAKRICTLMENKFLPYASVL